MNSLFENIRLFNQIEFAPTYAPDKAWSYFNLYYLREIKDIYLLYAKYPTIDNIQTLKTICAKENVISENGKEWTYRNLLEIVNALHKIELIDITNHVIDPCLFKSPLNASLLPEDRQVFEQLYYQYIRFVDFHSLFNYINPNVKCLFYYKEQSRFFNRFITNMDKEETGSIVSIGNDASEISRFWDVYLKWGEELNILHKYPLKLFGISYPSLCKDLSISYFLNNMPSTFSITDYIENDYSSDYIYLPKLYWEIILKHGFSIGDINERLLEECRDNHSKFQLQSTSAIFVTPMEAKILPKVEDKYMSHLLKIK